MKNCLHICSLNRLMSIVNYMSMSTPLAQWTHAPIKQLIDDFQEVAYDFSLGIKTLSDLERRNGPCVACVITPKSV